ncbi:hypothetical protein BJ875DRAFT_466239 [Amylocarpus encephaloides]|uniref:Uncharacterized protein n=1 Tax=Amylocarpus encephaloides TaxID=45428 RepID=A0A9P8C544_9HELO|nr:hypothetical protein BJ875DRAFT_466239 [Amylocarpus encephaloides]
MQLLLDAFTLGSLLSNLTFIGCLFDSVAAKKGSLFPPPELLTATVCPELVLFWCPFSVRFFFDLNSMVPSACVI